MLPAVTFHFLRVSLVAKSVLRRGSAARSTCSLLRWLTELMTVVGFDELAAGWLHRERHKWTFLVGGRFTGKV